MLIIMPQPPYGGALSVDGRHLSVRLSVCPVPNHKSRMERHGKLKIGKKEAHDMSDP